MQKQELTIELEEFQGPFDLLLHLIRTMKIDIHDIPMQEITEQYLAYVSNMDTESLDLAADYLVMAATLIEIKSRLLLPVEVALEEDDEFLDPREKLVQQLLLYQQFQTVAEVLEVRQNERNKHYSRKETDLTPYQEFIPLEEGAITLTDLSQAMQSVLIRERERMPIEREIEKENLSISEQADYILDKLDNNPKGLYFSDLSISNTRFETITNFIAMLELVRKSKIIFEQEELMGPIKLLLGGY